MNYTSTITSLSELRERKEQISAELDASKEALIKSIKPASSSASSFLLKDIALPVIGVGIAVFAVSKIMSANKRRNSQPEDSFQQTAEPQATNPALQQRSYSISQNEAAASPRPAPKNRLAPLMKLAGVIVPAAQAILAAVKEDK